MNSSHISMNSKIYLWFSGLQMDKTVRYMKKTKGLRKRIPIFVIILMPYILFALAFISGSTGIGYMVRLLLAVAAMYVFAFVPGLIYICLLSKMQFDRRKVLFWAMLIKLCYIPLYIFIVICGGLTNIIAVPFTLLFMAFSYSMVLTSSVFSIKGIIMGYREGVIRTGEALLWIILQFIFCLDVIGTVCCYIKQKHD